MIESKIRRLKDLIVGRDCAKFPSLIFLGLTLCHTTQFKSSLEHLNLYLNLRTFQSLSQLHLPCESEPGTVSEVVGLPSLHAPLVRAEPGYSY